MTPANRLLQQPIPVEPELIDLTESQPPTPLPNVPEPELIELDDETPPPATPPPSPLPLNHWAQRGLAHALHVRLNRLGRRTLDRYIRRVGDQSNSEDSDLSDRDGPAEEERAPRNSDEL